MSTPAQPAPPLSDALGLFAKLTAADVRARLDALDDERRALLTLLRSLLARERAAARRQEVRRDE
jgi:hypothetical protein